MKTKLIFALMAVTIMNSIAQKWTPVGAGLVEDNKPKAPEVPVLVYDDPPEKHNGKVNALAVYQDELYAGGYFKYSGSKSFSNIAKWNGKEWSSVGKGLEGAIFAMCVYKDELYVCGNFKKAGAAAARNIAKWNGKKWSAVGEGLASAGSEMIVFKDELVVAGLFQEAGGVKVNHIARWDGVNWSALGDGVPNDIMSMAAYKGELYAGGTFIDANSKDPNLFKWDGKKWKGVASFDGAVTGLAKDEKNLYATGFFNEADGKEVSRTAQTDGKTWTPVGNQGSYQTRSGDKVGTLFYSNGTLYATGRVWDEDTKKNAITGQWTGGKWTALGNGLFGSVSVFALYRDELYAAGSFIVSGSLDFSNIAKIKLK